MKKKVLRFDIRLEGNVASIETDRTRIGTLETLLKMIFHEYSKKKPEELDKFMQRLNTLYEFIRNRGQPLKEIDEPLDDFDFWKMLMERPPLKNG
ncbi:hypothetical protein GNQ08_21355 [Paenibacillus macerans]|uniref:Uncharacterized protein n=1 Tax=Paenibacillus macerans TaxID=44252 RepID=A0A6N8EZ11_PAEMA|nr:hypothetical protein [Paenibacillus macerans]MBS5910272.1 hypothetical protein [Paenibacillus macerans]MEC0329341.1 hypothetical protein [Paenibacillus macerans]MUG24915.1 hypothetical protein [Paenibacillus macerans]